MTTLHYVVCKKIIQMRIYVPQWLLASYKVRLEIIIIMITTIMFLKFCSMGSVKERTRIAQASPQLWKAGRSD